MKTLFLVNGKAFSYLLLSLILTRDDDCSTYKKIGHSVRQKVNDNQKKTFTFNDLMLKTEVVHEICQNYFDLEVVELELNVYGGL